MNSRPLVSRPCFSLAIFTSLAFCALLIPSRAQIAASSKGATPNVPILRIGEFLNYRIDWQRYQGAATAQLQIVDRGEFLGVSTWHFRAALHTAGPFRALYSLDDKIDSYALFADLEGRYYQEHLREYGRPEDTAGSLVSPGEDSRAPLPHVIVPRGTRDALSAIYLLRVKHWSDGQELRTPVYDGSDVYELIAAPEQVSAVHVPAGDYRATEIAVRLLDAGKEIPDEHLTVWIAQDAARTPVQCEANLSIGLLRIELISDSASEANAGADRVNPPARSSLPAGN